MIDLIKTERFVVSVGFNGRLHSVGLYLYGAATPEDSRKPGSLSRTECEVSFPLIPSRVELKSVVAWWRPRIIVWFKDGTRFVQPSYAKWPNERA